MPRQPRIHVPGGLYHAVLRGNHRNPIFGGSGDYLRFEEIVARAVERYGANLFAYCWMTNHVHLAIRVTEAPLGAVMGIVASRYARAKQRALETTGHLFERRYRSRLIDEERYLLTLVRYIHLNPVRACLVPDPRDHRWTNHHAYLGATCPPWLCLEPVVGRLGPSPVEARAAYLRFMGAAPAVDEREELSTTARSDAPGRVGRGRSSTSATTPSISLETIAAEVAGALALTAEDLRSSRRRPDLAQARREFARRALLEGVANLSQIARYLNRAPSTLSCLLYDRRKREAAKS